MITIRQVQVDDWQLVKQIRLQALSEAPHAFGETLEEATSMPDEEWLDRTRLNAEGQSSSCWLAFVDERAVGIAAGLCSQGDPDHANLVSMWVAPDVRDRGLGRLLAEAVALWARQRGAKQLLAEVTTENRAAADFYLRLDFTRTPMASIASGHNIVLSRLLSPKEQSDKDKNKQVVREFVDAINNRDWNRLEELVDSSFVRHSYAAGQPEIRSLNDLIRFLKEEFETFPDGRETILDLLAEGDRIAARHRFTGTQTGAMGRFSASGKKMTAEYIAIYRLKADRIVEAWAEWDNLSGLAQLGHYEPEDL